jgi:hypothetical protein
MDPGRDSGLSGRSRGWEGEEGLWAAIPSLAAWILSLGLKPLLRRGAAKAGERSAAGIGEA